jgi:hypothetical protein
MATIITEALRQTDWLKREADGGYSREAVVVASGEGLLPSGRVLGRIRFGAPVVAAKAGGNTGNGAMTLTPGASLLPGVKVGVYRVRCVAAAVNGGTFRVEDPDGFVKGDVAVGVAFADDIGFTIADGAADFIVGDGFDVTVPAGTGKWRSVTVAATDGSAVAAGILLDEIDATAADAKAVVIARDAVVTPQALSYGADVDLPAERAAVQAALGAINPPILVREGA